MAGNTDFLALYQELGLSADCTSQELKRAYRKRVSELHPDRAPENSATMQGLQRLNALYTNAVEFQHRHGRLPGAVQQGPVTRPSAPHPLDSPRPDAEPRPARGGRTILVLAIAVATGFALWLWADGPIGQSPDNAAPDVAPTARQLPVQERPVGSQTIELGSSAQQVRTIHGEPISGWEQRWEYGPSWVGFRCGEVIDWYSSPLRPLKVATPRPPATTTWSPPKNCKE